MAEANKILTNKSDIITNLLLKSLCYLHFTLQRRKVTIKLDFFYYYFGQIRGLIYLPDVLIFICERHL